ncbi:Subtilisin-like protease SBT1.4 [Dichanthelium oligosanthes]|uniref:Subtilisin-like protease SBT1.4 n=1 Tax=Dichanthelium oligosanthes TaxID=888268 RepID=A0A1E5W4T9_9POAL|nr:Subtilisin-like protease SBT1.4 [Dichanthelium oligosanthes]
MVRRIVVAVCLLLAVAAAATAAAAGEPEAEAMSSYIAHVADTNAPRPSSRTPRRASPARLTGRQAAHLETLPFVRAVVPDEMLQLHTTMTPSFLRLSASSGLIPATDGATDVVIGVIDTGIYPQDRASFAANPSLPPPPSRFRGSCVSTPSFNASVFCNNKLVGAKFFHEGAIRKGIVVSASAGNDGPADSTVCNVAPWILTIGASTINRRFPDTVVLGNRETITGTSLYAGPPLSAAEIPLVHGGDMGSRFCEAGKLNKTMVAAKIVLCDYGVNGGIAKGEAVKFAGGAGAILAGIKDMGEIASFSSHGPSCRGLEIIKPDVTAPGVNILAAWTGQNSPTGLDTDMRRVRYSIVSGTSMSCPHVSAVAALLRQPRPDWSPAAMKSALMTTTYVLDNAGNIIKDMSTGKASTPFARGSGHVDPNRALNPGLVYDAEADDYISFLCASVTPTTRSPS